MKSSPPMPIGVIAAQFGLATHVLRHWESMGLLAPTRAEGQRRRYRRSDLYRIAMILRAKEAGFSLEDIREMMLTEDAAVRQQVLRRHREDLARRIAQAQASLDMIDCAMECDHEDFVSCPHFQEMIAEIAERRKPGSLAPTWLSTDPIGREGRDLFE